MIGKTISHYHILEKLGEGGMGVVYKAEDTKLERIVAIKFLPHHIAANAEERERFKIEAKAAAALNHPNIATIYAIEEIDGDMFIVMEFIEGKELRKIVETSGPDVSTLPIEKFLHYATQIAKGLKAAHAKGITHRDIKSSNIMVTESGQVKIMDFGLAKIGSGAHLTKSGMTLGTAAYMSPEQTWGEPVDHRTDIWSFGVVLYEMLTGRLPFRGEYEQAVIYSILNEEPEFTDQIPANFRAILQKMLAKSPDERYQFMDEILLDLRDTQASRSQTVSKVKSRPAMTKRLPLLIGGLVVLSSLLVLAIFVFQPTPEDSANRKSVTYKNSIAVLPFENLSADAENEYFSDGITEDVLAQIAKISHLKVISRGAIRLYKNTEKSPREIGAELDVATLLMGTVRRDGEKLRVGCELVEVATGEQLWSGTYDRKMENVFAIQSEIAQQIAQTLKAELSGEELAEITQPLTANLEAYDYYLRGNDYNYYHYLNKQDIEMAVRMYEKAVELDNSFVIAYAALAFAHLKLGWEFGQKENFAKAKAAVDKAQALAPDLPETHIALGYYYYRALSDYDQALDHLMIAQRRRPNDPASMAAIGWIQRRKGEWQNALANIEKAVELNPRDFRGMPPLGDTFYHMRQYVQAIRYLDRAISLAPNDPLAYDIKFKVYLDGFGEIDSARQVINAANDKTDRGLFRDQAWRLDISERNYEQALKKLELGPGTFKNRYIARSWASDSLRYYLSMSWTYYLMKHSSPAQTYADSARIFLCALVKRDSMNASWHGLLGIAYAILGDKEKALQEGNMAVKLRPRSKDAFDGPTFIELLARQYAIVGEYDAAIDQLAYLLSIPSEMTVHRLKLDPIWDPLREHPRFKALLEKYSEAQK